MARWPVCVCAARTLWETRLPPPADWSRNSAPVLGAEPRAAGDNQASSEGAESLSGRIEEPTAEGDRHEEASHLEQPAFDRSRTGLSWWLSATVVAADQISKAIVHATLAPFDSVT